VAARHGGQTYNLRRLTAVQLSVDVDKLPGSIVRNMMSLAVPGSHHDDPSSSQGGALFVPAGTGLTKWVSGDVYTLKATAETTNGSLGFVEASVPPGGGPAAHIHDGADEAFYLITGELEFLDGERTFTAHSGDFVFVPRGIRHRFTNKGLHTAKLLFLFNPAGVETSFSEGGDDPEPGVAPPQWDMPRFLRLQEVMEQLKVDTHFVPERA
jgi:quercetin dioxygenase-like cupin family protein